MGREGGRDRSRRRSQGRGKGGGRGGRGAPPWRSGERSESPSRRRKESKARKLNPIQTWAPRGGTLVPRDAVPTASSSKAAIPTPPPPIIPVSNLQASPQILITGPAGRSTLPNVTLPPGWTACSFSPHPLVNNPARAPMAAADGQEPEEPTHLRWNSGESEPMAASPRPPNLVPGSYQWWCAPGRTTIGQPAGFPARRAEHSLQWYGWTYKNQPPTTMDAPTDVHSLTIGIFACGKNHVWGFGPHATMANPEPARFKSEYVLTDNFMFKTLASMMGDARGQGPPRQVPQERHHAVWVIDCCDFPHVGQGTHIGKHQSILRLVYDSPGFKPIRHKLIRFVDYIRYHGRSALTNDNIFLYSYLYVRFSVFFIIHYPFY